MSNNISHISWTIIYDTIYGCQDRADDLKAGVKSTSVLFGPHTRTALALFAAIFMACLVTAGITNEQGPWYFFLSVGGAFCHLFWQLYTVDLDDPADCWKKFVVRDSIFVGSIATHRCAWFSPMVILPTLFLLECCSTTCNYCFVECSP